MIGDNILDFVRITEIILGKNLLGKRYFPIHNTEVKRAKYSVPSSRWNLNRRTPDSSTRTTATLWISAV